MKKVSVQLQFFIDLARTQAVLSRRFDGAVASLGFNEFMILYNLSQAKDQKLRRIDLAARMGLTASGVTRILLGMEKIGLVKRQSNPQDARVSYVLLAAGGKRMLSESLEDAEYLAEAILPSSKTKKIKEFSVLLQEMTGSIL